MDWTRRNWPDLVIGVALILVIGAIIATLMTGGSIFNIGRSPLPNPITNPEENQPLEVNPRNEGPVANITPLPLNDNDSTGAEEASELAFAPSVPSPNPDTGRSEEESFDAEMPIVVADLSPGSEESGRYRVSVGAFGSQENAENLLHIFRDQDYPVFLGRQGELFIVLVGPYHLLKEAESVSERIELDDNGVDSTLVYTYDPNDGMSITTQLLETVEPDLGWPTVPQLPTEEHVIEQQEEDRDAPATRDSERNTFLQVGAYGSEESARPQVERLRALGYPVTSREEDGFIKLLVGPLSAEAIPQIRDRLLADGIDNFVR
jgi:cell division septation protein DedD